MRWRKRRHSGVETRRRGEDTQQNSQPAFSARPSFPPGSTVCSQTHLSSQLTWGRAKSFTLHHWFTPWETSCWLQNTLWSNFLKGTSIFTNVFHMIKLWKLSPVWQYLREMWGLGRKCLWSALSSPEGKHDIRPRCCCTPWCYIGATASEIA